MHWTCVSSARPWMRSARRQASAERQSRRSRPPSSISKLATQPSAQRNPRTMQRGPRTRTPRRSSTSLSCYAATSRQVHISRHTRATLKRLSRRRKSLTLEGLARRQPSPFDSLPGVYTRNGHWSGTLLAEQCSRYLNNPYLFLQERLPHPAGGGEGPC
ncbi:hypothetical protein T492DRAFT_1063521 [Pavlovales sp. CCMP2436]|nr:hypothetical protein T492DRAFT_1063521 [Pavlovales sp. CCMP2436]